MSVVFCGVSPHPPILIPEIGREELAKCRKSREGLQLLAQKLMQSNPEILVLITPHGPVFQDAVSVYTYDSFSGDFRFFQAPHVKVEIKGYPSLAEKILSLAESKKISVLELNEITSGKLGISPFLDHAAMVPLYYFQEAGLNVPLVLISMGLLPYSTLFQFGHCLREAAQEEKKRTAVIASGDLSHRLSPNAPAGYDPVGREFDGKVIRGLQEADAEILLNLDSTLIERAGECGFRPILILLGAIQGLAVQREILSYEGPFGVGYPVAAYPVEEKFHA